MLLLFLTKLSFRQFKLVHLFDKRTELKTHSRGKAWFLNTQTTGRLLLHKRSTVHTKKKAVDNEGRRELKR